MWSVLMLVCSCQLLEAQADYHRRSLAALEATLPTIQIQQGEEQTFVNSANITVQYRENSDAENAGGFVFSCCLAYVLVISAEKSKRIRSA